MKGSGITKAPILKNAATAPFIYFDGAPALGQMAGAVEIELCARVVLPQADGSTVCDMVCVAHLRSSVAAAANLHEALGRALAMAGHDLNVAAPDGAGVPTRQ